MHILSIQYLFIVHSNQKFKFIRISIVCYRTPVERYIEWLSANDKCIEHIVSAPHTYLYLYIIPICTQTPLVFIRNVSSIQPPKYCFIYTYTLYRYRTIFLVFGSQISKPPTSIMLWYICSTYSINTYRKADGTRTRWRREQEKASETWRATKRKAIKGSTNVYIINIPFEIVLRNDLWIFPSLYTLRYL